MDVLQTVILICSGLVAIILGFKASLHHREDEQGYDTGVYLGGIVSLLAGLMLGQLFGGWGEEILGDTIGLPIGMFVGCFAGVFSASTLWGVLGRIISRSLRN